MCRCLIVCRGEWVDGYVRGCPWVWGWGDCGCFVSAHECACMCVRLSVLCHGWVCVCECAGMSRLEPLLSLYCYCSCTKYLPLCMPLHCLHLMKRT